jgi:chemotaxis protein methyltransferase CheR
MTVLPLTQDVIRFRALLAELLGLQFDESKFAQLARVLHERAAAEYTTCAAYLDRLAGGGARDEIGRLARELTVTETYFFRNPDQFAALVEVALPERFSAHASAHAGAYAAAAPVRVLSAGCASGEEPYSLVIAARERWPLAAEQVQVSAVDLNPAMLDKAARARYSAWSLREVPATTQARWFRSEGNVYVLDPSIQRAVHFEERNLVIDDPHFWQAQRYDIVFCRNLLMYFTVEQAQAAVARLAHALVPDGYLFLGHAETLRGLSRDFHLCHTHGTYYYRRKRLEEQDAAGVIGIALPLPAQIATQAATQVLRADAADTTWVETVQRAAARIDALAGVATAVAAIETGDHDGNNNGSNDSGSGNSGSGNSGRGHADCPAAAAAVAPRGTPAAARRDAHTKLRPALHDALQSLHYERFGHALAQLHALPAEYARDPDVLLLKAVSLIHSGAIAAAERTCRELLALDELNAGAHYVLALCCESAGDADGALEHDQVAVYLDPHFAMPLLHMGLLARRLGDRASAQRHLTQALELLGQEDAARVLLFGGGFKREALMALCRAERAACGASA